MDTSKLFDFSKDFIYLNHASSAPLAKPTRERMVKLIDDLRFGDALWDFWKGVLADLRRNAAKLVNSSEVEIGFIPSTSMGLLIACYSIPWRQGDNMVLLKDGFPANLVPWEMNLETVEKRFVDRNGETSIEERIMEAVDDKTRAVAVDWVDFFTGRRLNLEILGEFCRHKDIFLIVDGIQGAGAIEIDLAGLNVDFFAAQSAKWLLGPVGAGFLYVNSGTMDRLKPAFLGWMSLDWQDFNIFDPLPPLKRGAARFEPGSYPGIPLVGFCENLKIINSVGIRKINHRIFELGDRIIQGLSTAGTQLISPTDEECRSGITTFRLKGKDSGELWTILDKAGIKVSLRKNAIRVSPHFYNTDAEINCLLSQVESFLQHSQ